MTKKQLLAHLTQLSACNDARKWVESAGSVNVMWRDCKRADWMLWIAARAGVDRKLIVTVACACARTALKYVKVGEDRPRIAIETAEAWVRGEVTIEQVQSAAYAASDAAYAAYAAYAASDAAYAASDAAYASYAAYAASAAYAAYAASYAAYAAYAAYAYARSKSLASMANIVRQHITAKMVIEALEK